VARYTLNEWMGCNGGAAFNLLFGAHDISSYLIIIIHSSPHVPNQKQNPITKGPFHFQYHVEKPDVGSDKNTRSSTRIYRNAEYE
jgi:hypothetical protein